MSVTTTGVELIDEALSTTSLSTASSTSRELKSESTSSSTTTTQTTAKPSMIDIILQNVTVSTPVVIAFDANVPETTEVILMTVTSTAVQPKSEGTEVILITVTSTATQPATETTEEEPVYLNTTTKITPVHHSSVLPFVLGAFFLFGLVVTSLVCIFALYLCRPRLASVPEEALPLHSPAKSGTTAGTNNDLARTEVPSAKGSPNYAPLIQSETKRRSSVRLWRPFADSDFWSFVLNDLYYLASE